MTWLYVALGSALGGVGRYALGSAIQHRFAGPFPTGTLLINVTGSFLLGVIMRYAAGGGTMSHETRLFLATGLCGGYTTFSAFSYETAFMMDSGEYRRAALYVSLSVVLSIAATFLGVAVAQSALSLRGRG